MSIQGKLHLITVVYQFLINLDSYCYHLTSLYKFKTHAQHHSDKRQ